MAEPLCRQAAQTGIRFFLRLLREQADGDTFSLQRAEQLAERVMGLDRVGGLFNENAERCLSQFHEERLALVRADAFGRLVVQTFAKLLEDEVMPRSMLPGFFQALRLLMGETTLFDHRVRCLDIVDRLRNDHGRAFTWDHFYADPAAQDLLCVTLAIIARAFHSGFEARRTWFRQMMETLGGFSPLGAPGAEGTSRGQEAPLPFTDDMFCQMMRLMLDPIRPERVSPERRRLIHTKTRVDVNATVVELFIRLTKLEHEVKVKKGRRFTAPHWRERRPEDAADSTLGPRPVRPSDDGDDGEPLANAASAG